MHSALKALTLLATTATFAAASPTGWLNYNTTATPTATGCPQATYDTSVTNTATASSDLAAAAATAKTESPTSFVKGKAFDRIAMIYLETTAYNNTIADENCKALIDQGILLSNNYGVGTPSQPNYIAPASGDDFGLNSDSFIVVDKNVSTIVDLLEDKGISWSDYNEGLPYTGFQGFNLTDEYYARKHNLLIRFKSITNDEDRLAKIKNLTMFEDELAAKQLPQWIFVTPDLINDGHDTNISVSCAWTRSFVEPLLADPYFNNNTLVYITWQANGQYPTERNHVAGIMLGSAVPSELKGTVDSNFYNHYSELSSVEANWGLHTLGRWDVGANVWEWVGRKTGDVIRKWNNAIAGDGFENYYWNQSYGGVFSSANTSSHLYVAPNLELVHNGRTVLPAIVETWGGGNRDGGADEGYGGDEGADEKDDGEYKRDYKRPSSTWKNGNKKDDGEDRDGQGKGGRWSFPKHGGGKGGHKGGDNDGGHHDGGHYGGGDNDGDSCFQLPSYYRDIVELPDALHPPKGYEVPIGLSPADPIFTPIAVYPVQEI